MDASDVNRLIEASQTSHAAYRRAANPTTGTPNYKEAELHIAKAQRDLMAAHEADPDHHSSGWANLRVPYERLILFYSRYAEIP